MASFDSFPAKIVPPKYSEVIKRNRLFKVLDEKREHPGVWMSAPAGAGKTTLISSYAESRRVQVLWYQLDRTDSDPAAFFYYLRLATQQLNRQAAAALPLYTPEYTNGTMIFSRRAFEHVFAIFSGPALIVFDNYQDLPGNGDTQRILKAAVEWLPHHITMLFASRSAAPKQFARALANNRMATIDRRLLRFTVEETIALAKLTGKGSLRRQHAVKLHEITDGWAAGIVLYLKSHCENPQWISKSATTMTPTEIIDYFSEEVFDLAEDNVKSLLVNTAYLPQMTGDMAARVTGVKNAQEILLEMVRANSFINLRHGDPVVFQSHQLFREFLLKKAKQDLDEKALAALKSQSAQELDHEGYWEDALPIYFDQGDVNQATRLILAHAKEMIATGRHATLHAWLQSLPEHSYRENAWICYWLGASLLPTNPDMARPYLEDAYRTFRKKNDLNGKFNAQCAVLESITYRFDRLGLLDQWLVKDDHFLSSYFDHADRNDQMRCVFAVLNALAFSHPKQIDYALWEERAMQLIASNLDATLKIQISLPMLAYQIYKGDFVKGFDILAHHPPIDGNAMIPPLIMVSLHALLTSLYWHAGVFDKSKLSAAAGLDCSEKTGIHLVVFMTLVNAAQCALSDGDVASTKSIFNKMSQLLHQAGSYETTYWYLNSVWLNLIEGRIVDALRHSAMAIGSAEKSGCRKIEPIAYLGRALALWHGGESHSAEESLATAIDLCETLNTRHTLFACYLAKAEMGLHRQDDETLSGSLERAFQLARQNGYLTSFYWRKEVLGALCIEALKRGIEVDYVRHCITRRNLISKTPPLSLNHWPWPVRIYTLGRFGIVIHEEPFQFNGRVRQRPFDLLKTIIALDTGDGVAEHEIQDILWPQAEGDAAVRSYTITLHRLRRLLDCKEALRVSGGRISIDDRYVWIDIELLKRNLAKFDEKFRKLAPDAFPESPIELMNHILDLVGGDFLPGEQRYPILAMRSKIKSSVFDRILLLTRRLERLEAWETAVEWLKKALAIDDCSEACYQKLLACYRRLGLNAEAHMAFGQCSRNLDHQLGIKPSEATLSELNKLK
jgi:LuxR family maltose regulon positive regulatory protein